MAGGSAWPQPPDPEPDSARRLGPWRPRRYAPRPPGPQHPHPYQSSYLSPLPSPSTSAPFSNSKGRRCLTDIGREGLDWRTFAPRSTSCSCRSDIARREPRRRAVSNALRHGVFFSACWPEPSLRIRSKPDCRTLALANNVLSVCRTGLLRTDWARSALRDVRSGRRYGDSHA